MFKKICFMVCAISMAFSAESFAKRHPSQENLERRALAKTRANAKKHIRHAAEKPAAARARANAKRFMKKEQAGKRHAAKTRVKPDGKRIRNAHAAKRHAVSATTPKRVPQKSRTAVKRENPKKLKVPHGHTKNKVSFGVPDIEVNGHKISDANSYVEVNGRRIKGGKSVIVTNGKKGTYNVDVDGVRTVIPDTGKGMVVSSSNGSSVKRDGKPIFQKGDFNTGDWTGSWAEFDKAMAQMDED